VLDGDECGEQEGGRDQLGDDLRRRPSSGVAAQQAEDPEEEPTDEEGLADPIDSARLGVLRLTQPDGPDQTEQSQWQVDEEDRAPANRRRE
jgi:hypothetical protein